MIVSDTAGIRDAAGSIEREGIRRSFAAARAADLRLWLSETGIDEPPDEISSGNGFLIRSKSDLGGAMPADAIPISIKPGAGLDDLIRRISAEVRDRVGANDQPALTQARHRHNLEAAEECLRDFLSGDAGAVELRADDVRRAAHALGRITGRVDVEDVLDQIFSRFCIGK